MKVLSPVVTVEDTPLEEVDSFIYHGSVIDGKGGTEADIKARTAKARDWSTTGAELVFSFCNILNKMATSTAPCKVGDPVSEIETPAAVLCLDSLESNLRTLPELMKPFPNVAIRPHIKNHKCPVIALRQIKAGAVGVCCQTVGEAEEMARAGIEDILICNQIISRKKQLRLAALARQAIKISVCVDSRGNVEDLSQVAGDFGVTFDLVVDVNIGYDRCGVEPGKAVADLAELIQSLLHVKFKGIQCYNGDSLHVVNATERKVSSSAGIEKAKIAVQVVQMSTGDEGDRAVLDAGHKALGMFRGCPMLKDFKELKYVKASAEHGIVRPCGDLKIGDKVWLIPGQCDACSHLHKWLVGVRAGVVESLWPVVARGPAV
ncbi:3-hydroxy-D-aspartate aldolase [Aplysia californica]|uniref:3-hydroxy-D-aspartate aldolase n=1 Tax=Aplysia californica TaxID=6500 RepID=A0ABM0JEQ3_APLCA|nr:3-hydroxy-D-aspartate aldolase [Aplysia californica]